jgi:hypothetical protein
MPRPLRIFAPPAERFPACVSIMNRTALLPDVINRSRLADGCCGLRARFVTTLFFAVTLVQSAIGADFDFKQATETLTQACGDCHANGAHEGEFSLDGILQSDRSLKDHFERWQKVRERINDRSMPPADVQPMEADARDGLVQWIATASVDAVCEDGPKAGPPLLRRLAKYEYSNTIRDLLDVHFDVGQGLPEDTAGGEGFANAAETLIISPIHAEKYLQAAVDALDYALKNESTRERLLSTRPSETKEEATAAGENIRRLADRAFRRPVEDVEVEKLVQLFQQARDDGLSFDEAVLYAMRGVLISPSFLFIAEAPPKQVGVEEFLSDHELATRLSYFLWASTPDKQLRKLADEGKLSDSEVLKKEVLRMISERGTHLQDSMENFMGSWLGTADLGRSKKIDRQRHSWVDDPDVAALRNQPVYAMESILQENDSLLSLIDADWTFLNDELVRVYKLQKKKIEGDFVQRLKRVKLPEEYRYRGGLLGMGGVYVVSSYPRRSSPVLRGAWVLEKMLGVELPPPPPDVPSLEETEGSKEPQTLRQRLELHRQDAGCASCHNRIDPIGFAMENFDEIGRWRDNDEGGPIDAVAELPGGVQLDGLAGLKQHLLTEKQTFVRNLTRKMLGYALGRSLQPSDLCTVELIVKRLEENDYRAQELVLGIVMSEPFRKKTIFTGE